MKCYYEILGVDKTVTSDVIKKAYYKLSLKWHPDKNPDNISEATEVFQQIQTAYKVLSNPQERSWYDKNRERFLSMSFNSEDELYDLINNVFYQGYGDDENGFYAKYEFVFSVLIEREKDACRFRGENLETIPNFGNSLSDYKDIVGPFYFFWESFSTKMSFHWKNKHEIDLSIPRDIRRAMEKENTDERNTARKQYNKTIQNLISTLKSRDPRIKVWKEKLQSKAKDNEKKAVKMAQKAWERSHRKLNFQNSVPSYGDFTVDELEEKLNNLEIEHGKTCIDEENDKEDLLCVSCNKYFKSVAAFNNHEKSKNHKKNLAALRELMMKENEEFFADLNDIPVKERSSNSEINRESERDAINELECDIPFNNDNEADNVQIQSDCISNEILIQEKISENNIDYTTVDDKKSENSIDNTTVDDKISVDNTTVDDKISVDNTTVDDKVIINEVKSEKKRRRKPKSERERVETISKTIDDSLICDKCGNEFPTRNKLFQHVKSSGHATIKDMKKNKK